MEKIHKHYILPTNNWLRPIRLLSKNSTNIYDADLIENEIKKRRIIVKVTKTNTIDMNSQDIYNVIGKSPHVVKIYNFITCYEDPHILNANFKDALGFCKGGVVDKMKDNKYEMIHLELIKKYPNSLNEFIESLSVNKTKILLRYVLCIQLDLFCSYGFIHNDIHPGNIMIDKTNTKELDFSFCGDNKKINIFCNLFLTDFEYSIIYSYKHNPKIRTYLTNPNVIKFTNSFEYQIIKTFREFINLVKDRKLQNELNERLEKWIETDTSKLHFYKSLCVKQMFNYANLSISEYLFISQSYNLSIEIINILFKLLFNDTF
jgi:serine/threonine protein kinase